MIATETLHRCLPTYCAMFRACHHALRLQRDWGW